MICFLRLRFLPLALAVLALAGPALADPAARYDEAGNLIQPKDYREWVFLGATVSPNDLNAGSAYSPGIKHTYMDRESFADYKRTGSFKTGTVIVQESLATEQSKFMNATGYFAGEYLGLQVMVKDADRFDEAGWGFFSFGTPPYMKAVPVIPGMGEFDCAGCHTYANQDWVFTHFYPMLAAAAPDQLTDGKALFDRDWTAAATAAAAQKDDTGDGLGPLFNARSCKACHPEGERGAFKVRADGVIEGDGLMLKVGNGKYGDPAYGGQIQPFALNGIKPEGVPAVRYEKVTHVSGRVLRKPIFELRDPGYGALDPASRIAGRLAQAIGGNGDLERVPLAALEALADPDDEDGDGVSGRLNRVELSMGRIKIGRFGWKAGQWLLKVQTSKAFRMDMGLSSKLIGPAWGDCTPVQKKCVEAAHGERAAKGGREISVEVEEKVTAHVAGLPVPPRRGYDIEGEQVFQSIGCSACHAPSLPLPDGGTVHAFTDLLLHDMGDGLADGFIEGSASASEWRTAPLMGVGRLLEKNMPLLHDGRARDAHEAVLWHQGEAAGAAQAFSDLNDDKRAALIRFLETL